MAVKTEGTRIDDVVLSEADGRYSREVAIIGTGANLVAGAVLGQITASKKWILSTPGASDGSQVPKAVLITPAAAASADVVDALIITRHARVRRAALTFAAAIDDATKRQAAVDALKGAGIITDA